MANRISGPMRRSDSYQDLIAWQKAYEFGLAVYRFTESFPERERFGLTAMLRRNLISVPSFIADGYGRGNTADYLRQLKSARGGLYQIDTQLMFGRDMKYIGEEEHAAAQERLFECEKVLAGLIRSLEGGPARA